MKVGDLVNDKHGNMGIITKQMRHHNRHVWVQWCCGGGFVVNTRYLEVINESR